MRQEDGELKIILSCFLSLSPQPGLHETCLPYPPEKEKKGLGMSVVVLANKEDTMEDTHSGNGSRGEDMAPRDIGTPTLRSLGESPPRIGPACALWSDSLA